MPQKSDLHSSEGGMVLLGWGVVDVDMIDIRVFPKIVGFPPKSSHGLIGVSMKYTIHFGVVSPYFWKHFFLIFVDGCPKLGPRSELGPSKKGGVNV